MSETITSVAELDALPMGSVVRDGLGGTFERMETDLRWQDAPNPPLARPCATVAAITERLGAEGEERG